MTVSSTPRSASASRRVPVIAYERMFWRVEEARPGTFRVGMVVQLDGRPEPHLLRLALSALQRRHPKLACVITAPDGVAAFDQETPASPIDCVVEDVAGPELPWRRALGAMLDEPWLPAGPMMRVRVLRQAGGATSVLLVAIHHALADGLSAVMIARDILTAYAAFEQGGDPGWAPLALVVAPRAAPTSWANRWWLFRRMAAIQRRERREVQTPLPEDPTVPPNSQGAHWVFSARDTAGIIKHCRRQQTSFGGAMLAAVCCGLVDALGVDEGAFKCQFPFDMRRSLHGQPREVGDDDLGCFASIINHHLAVRRSADLLDVARDVHRTVQEFIDRGGPTFYYNFGAVAEQARLAALAGRMQSSVPPRVTLLATHYGVVSLRSAYGTLRPRGATLMFNNRGVGPALVMEALVLGQQLNVGFAADRLDPVLWDRIQVAVRERFEVLARG